MTDPTEMPGDKVRWAATCKMMLEPSPPICLHTDYDQLTKQRDQLIRALEVISTGEDDCGCIATLKWCQTVADETLASVKESK